MMVHKNKIFVLTALALLAATACSRPPATPQESPWPELLALDAAAALAEQRILAGVGREELGRLSGELTLAISLLLSSTPPENPADAEALTVLLRELTRGHSLLTGGQSMNPDLLMRFHGISAAMMQAAGMAEFHQH